LVGVITNNQLGSAELAVPQHYVVAYSDMHKICSPLGKHQQRWEKIAGGDNIFPRNRKVRGAKIADWMEANVDQSCHPDEGGICLAGVSLLKTSANAKQILRCAQNDI